MSKNRKLCGITITIEIQFYNKIEKQNGELCKLYQASDIYIFENNEHHNNRI